LRLSSWINRSRLPMLRLGEKKPQVSPLRYAPVETTKLWRSWLQRLGEETAGLCAPPDFPSGPVALMHCVRLSEKKHSVRENG
jgi:hypothetical protein